VKGLKVQVEVEACIARDSSQFQTTRRQWKQWDVASQLRMDMTILTIKRKHLTLNEEEYE
jgi:hypothetical protein